MEIENAKTFIKEALVVDEVTDEQAQNVKVLLNDLSDREERVVRLYYGLDDRPRTFEEVARLFGVEEAIREMLAKAKKILEEECF